MPEPGPEEILDAVGKVVECQRCFSRVPEEAHTVSVTNQDSQRALLEACRDCFVYAVEAHCGVCSTFCLSLEEPRPIGKVHCAAHGWTKPRIRLVQLHSFPASWNALPKLI